MAPATEAGNRIVSTARVSFAKAMDSLEHQAWRLQPGRYGVGDFLSQIGPF